MANVDNPHGAVPVRHLFGCSISTNLYAIDASNDTAMFRGDFVKLEADGNIAPADATDVNILGVAVAYYDTNKRLILTNGGSLAASTAGYADVVDDPYVIFEIQGDGVDADTQRGANADIVATTGSTTTGISAHEISTAGVTAATAQLRIYGLYEDGVNAWGANTRQLVLINEHLFKSTAGI